MLKEINKLSVFFEDCYREVSVREYSREVKISPPTASKFLKKMEKNGLLKSRLERNNLLFKANRESIILKDLSRIYWNYKLKDFLEYLESFFPNAIVLFGSLSKLETKKDSDVDILFLGTKKDINFKKFEKKLKREIQVIFYDSLDKINDELKLNLLNSYILRGYLS